MKEEATTDTKRVVFTVEKFIVMLFAVASISATISGIINQIGSLADDDTSEKEARVKNDTRLQKEIETVESELTLRIKELENEIKELKDN